MIFLSVLRLMCGYVGHQMKREADFQDQVAMLEGIIVAQSITIREVGSGSWI